MNQDVSTGPLTCPFARLLTPLICLLRPARFTLLLPLAYSAALIHLPARSLTPKLVKVNDLCQNQAVLNHSALPPFLSSSAPHSFNRITQCSTNDKTTDIRLDKKTL